MVQNIFQKLISIARIPDSNRKDWLGNAEESVDLLKKSLGGDEIVLYASGPHMLIHSVITPNEVLDPPDHADLDRAHTMPDASWIIQRVYGGGEGHRVYLQPSLDDAGSQSLVGSEQLVFVRSFEGNKDYEPPMELSQKLVHSLGLHFLDERNAHCRLNDRGDIEPIITIYHDVTHDPWQRVRAVTIRPHDLATYMALTGTSLVTRFAFTRFATGGFSGWPDGAEDVFETKDLFYRQEKVPQQASYARGQIILRTKITPENLVEEWRAEEDTSQRQYASFIIVDRKNGDKVIATSCSPDHIVNYFSKSNLPWEISPAFFRPEVLRKYKSDPEKYTFSDRSLSCRNAWHLQTYDINEAGQVHTYIGYLANLPYEEQLYWQSFNEEPKAGISKRAFQTDILGEFTTEDDDLNELKSSIIGLDQAPPAWWKPRGSEMHDAVHYPATDSPSEWGDEIMALDHLAVEGFQVKALRVIIEANNGTYQKDWGSLKLLEISLASTGRTEDQAREAVTPFQELHRLRNPLKAHGNTEGRRLAVKAARKNHGTLRKQFTTLCERLTTSFSIIVATLPKQ